MMKFEQKITIHPGHPVVLRPLPGGRPTFTITRAAGHRMPLEFSGVPQPESRDDRRAHRKQTHPGRHGNRGETPAL